MTGRRYRWVAWEQNALDDLARHLGLNLPAQRVLRRLTLDADWRDHCLVIGSRTELAHRWHLGSGSGRRTVGQALDQLAERQCVRIVDPSIVEVSVYHVLVCPEDRDAFERAAATWIRPDRLTEVADAHDLGFQQRAVLEMLLTMALPDGTVSPRRMDDVATTARTRRSVLEDLVSAGVVEHAAAGLRIVGYEALVERPNGPRALPASKSEGARAMRAVFAGNARGVRGQHARFSRANRAVTSPLTSDFAPCTSTRNLELGDEAALEIVEPWGAPLADEVRRTGRSGVAQARTTLRSVEGEAVITLTESDPARAMTGTDGR